MKAQWINVFLVIFGVPNDDRGGCSDSLRTREPTTFIPMHWWTSLAAAMKDVKVWRNERMAAAAELEDDEGVYDNTVQS